MKNIGWVSIPLPLKADQWEAVKEIAKSKGYTGAKQLREFIQEGLNASNPKRG